jgi:hypothetical protein
VRQPIPRAFVSSEKAANPDILNMLLLSWCKIHAKAHGARWFLKTSLLKKKRKGGKKNKKSLDQSYA